MKGRVVKIKSEKPNLIHLDLRLKDNSKEAITVKNFPPRIYVEGDGEYKNPFGDRLRQVRYGNFSRTEDLRERYDGVHQDDIPFRRVFLVEKGIKSGVQIPDSKIDSGEVDHEFVESWDAREIKPRYCFIDIEVGSGGKAALDTDRASEPVIAVTLYDSFSENFMMIVLNNRKSSQVENPESILSGKGNFTEDSKILISERENQLLRTVTKFFEKTNPDVVIGWNVDYDINYLNNRFLNRGISYKIAVERFDLMEAYEQTKRLDYHPSLKSVVFEEGIVDERPQTAVQVIQDYAEEGDIVELIEYNFEDVDWLLQINEMYDLTGRFTSQKDMVGLEGYRQTFLRAVPIEIGLMRLVDRTILPHQPNNDIYTERENRKSEKYNLIEDRGGRIGARVTEPPREVIENVAVFDFSQYYPSIIVAWNLSPELEIDLPSKYDVQLDGYEDITPPKAEDRNQTGLLPMLCKEWFKERERVDKKIEQATPGTEKYKRLQQEKASVKTYVNAIYGYAGYERARLYDEDIIIKVGLVGRDGIKILEDVAEEEGYRHIFSDTDGVHIEVPFEEAKKLRNRMQEEVNKRLQKKYSLNQSPNIELDFEKFYKRIIFTGAKKRYCGLVKWEDGQECDYLDIKHFETIKSDSSPYAKILQKHLLEKVVRGRSKKELIEWFDKVRKSFKKVPIYRCEECGRKFPVNQERGCESCEGSLRKLREGNFEDLAYRKGIRKDLDEYKTLPRQARGALVSNSLLHTNFGKGSKPKVLLVKGVKGLDQETDVISFEGDPPEVEMDWKKERKLNLYDKVKEIFEIVGVNFKPLRMRAEGQKTFNF